MNFSPPNIIAGIIGIIIGFFLVKEAYYMNHHIYFLDFAEQKWGPGSGTILYRYIGLGMIVLSMLIMLGFFDLFGANSPLNNTGGSKLPRNNTPTNFVPSNNIAP
jgi:hypothetical protein